MLKLLFGTASTSSNLLRTSTRLGVCTAGLAMLMTGCNGPSEIEPGDETGTMRVRVSSDSGDEVIDASVDEVWVRIDSVQVQHETEGWIEIESERLDFDLLADTSFRTIADDEVWIGAYDRTFISVIDAWIIVDGNELELDFDGNFQASDPFPNGMYVTESIFVTEGDQTTLDVSWNLATNLQVSGGDSWSLGSESTATVEVGD